MEGKCNTEMNGTEICMLLQETDSLSFTEMYKLLEIVPQRSSRLPNCTTWHYFIEHLILKDFWTQNSNFLSQ